MKVANERVDALELVKIIHRQMRQLQASMDELEYLIYELDARTQIQFFGKGGVHDKTGSKE